MDISDTSSLSSAPVSDVERLAPIFLKAKGKAKGKAITKATTSPSTAISPPRPKRSPSPPHEPVLADNTDIAVSRVDSALAHQCSSTRRITSTYTSIFIVHRYVQVTISRRIPTKASTLRTSGYRAWCARFCTFRTSRTPPLRATWYPAQPQEACRVSLLISRVGWTETGRRDHGTRSANDGST